MDRPILFVVGNRPQFIKLLPVWTALNDMNPVLIHTGQHHDADMSDIFFRDLGLPKPDNNLGISGGSHGEQTGRLLAALETEFLRHKPAIVILFGDTNSTLAAALAAVKLHIPIAHVESGPRMNDGFESPEEANRVLTERIAALLFPPNAECVENLRRDGRSEGVHPVGDTMYDTFCRIRTKLAEKGAWDQSELHQRHQLAEDAFVLLTLHRPYNVDERDSLEKILRFLHELPHPVLFPVHPRTKKNLENFGLTVDPQQIRLRPPLGYVDMQQATLACRMLISDSGGVPKEAYFAEKRCLTLYPHTPWPQLEAAGWVRVVDPRTTLLSPGLLDWTPGPWKAFFGDGRAGESIADVVREFLRKRRT